MKKFVRQHDSEPTVAHRRRAGSEDDPLTGSPALGEIHLVGHRDRGDIGPLPPLIQMRSVDELRIGVGGHDGDFGGIAAPPIGAPEPFNSVDRRTDIGTDAGQQRIGAGTTETDQARGSAITDYGSLARGRFARGRLARGRRNTRSRYGLRGHSGTDADDQYRGGGELSDQDCTHQSRSPNSACGRLSSDGR